MVSPGGSPWTIRCCLVLGWDGFHRQGLLYYTYTVIHKGLFVVIIYRWWYLTGHGPNGVRVGNKRHVLIGVPGTFDYIYIV